MQRLMLQRDAAAVQRYHTKRTHRSQTLADHTYGVMQIMVYVDPEVSAEALVAAMFHDLPEVVTGDIPATAKQKHPRLKAELDAVERSVDANLRSPLSAPCSAEQALVKWADTYELICWCLEEWSMGNMQVIGIIATGVHYIGDPQYDDFYEEYPVAHNLYREAVEAYQTILKEYQK